MVMICIFCQTEHERLTSNNCCAPCQDWILSDRFEHVFNYFPDGNKTVAVLYYSIIAINDYKLSIYFDFNKNRTIIIEMTRDTPKVELILDYIPPITQKFIDEVPDKLKLWLTFS